MIALPSRVRTRADSRMISSAVSGGITSSTLEQIKPSNVSEGMLCSQSDDTRDT